MRNIESMIAFRTSTRGFIYKIKRAAFAARRQSFHDRSLPVREMENWRRKKIEEVYAKWEKKGRGSPTKTDRASRLVDCSSVIY